jgi:hypothetical protein
MGRFLANSSELPAEISEMKVWQGLEFLACGGQQTLSSPMSSTRSISYSTYRRYPPRTGFNDPPVLSSVTSADHGFQGGVLTVAASI